MPDEQDEEEGRTELWQSEVFLALVCSMLGADRFILLTDNGADVGQLILFGPPDFVASTPARLRESADHLEGMRGDELAAKTRTPTSVRKPH